MRNLLTAIFVFIATLSIGQKTIFPTFELGGQFGQDNCSRFVKENYLAGVGLYFFDQLNCLFNFGYFQNRIGKYESELFRNEFFNTGVSFQYRFLKSAKISPMVDFDFFTGLKNSKKMIFIDDSFDSVPSWTEDVIGTFNKYPIMFSTKIMADWKLNNFHLQVGGGYNIKSLRYIVKNSGLQRTETLHGFEISLNLMYVLKSKAEIDSK